MGVNPSKTPLQVSAQASTRYTRRVRLTDDATSVTMSSYCKFAEIEMSTGTRLNLTLSRRKKACQTRRKGCQTASRMMNAWQNRHLRARENELASFRQEALCDHFRVCISS